MNNDQTKMFPGKTVWLAAALLACGARLFADEPKITDRKVSVAAFMDMGQIVRGSLDDGQGTHQDLKGAFLNRDGVALNYSGTVNDNLHMNIGVGGLFWKPIPEGGDESSKRILFGPGISEASAQYDFSQNLNLKLGFFGYKYNSDATDLGEYLLRSEAYPNIIHTAGPGGWVWLNANEYKSMGMKLTWESLGGALRQDLLLFSEFNETPIFDFSPTYVATFKAGKSLELGGGFSLHRWLPIHPSVTTPSSQTNTYVKYNNFPEVQWQANVEVQDADGSTKTIFTSWRGGQNFDPATVKAKDPAMSKVLAVKYVQLGTAAGTREGLLFQMTQGAALTHCDDNATGPSDCTVNYLNSKGDSVLAVDANGAPVLDANGDPTKTAAAIAEEKQFTFKAIKVMGRASLNLGSMLGMQEESAGPFKLYAEAAILGVQNQPLLYNNIKQRIPIMLGADIPTFGVLSKLSVQMEYYKNPYPDNNYEQFQNGMPQPAYPDENPAEWEYLKETGFYNQDDIKWAVDAHKNLVPGLDVFLQVANDHFRVQDAFAEPSYAPVTHLKKDWYYMFRFQWNM